MDIVTGYRGEAHIKSNDHQAYNYGLIGDCILPVGMNLEGEIISSNELRIHDGELIHKGVHSRVKPGTHDTVVLPNGEQNMKRIDLVCVKYSKSQNNIETTEWVLKQGTPSSGTPKEPSYTKGDVVAGATLDETPVFKVEYDGLNPTVSPLLPVIMNAAELSGRVKGKKQSDTVFKNMTPYALECGSRVLQTGTARDDITLYTIPADIDERLVVASVTNGDYATCNIQMISTYIDTKKRTVHARINASRIPSWFRFNYIIWYVKGGD